MASSVIIHLTRFARMVFLWFGGFFRIPLLFIFLVQQRDTVIMVSLSEIVEQELGASPRRSKLSITSESSSLASVASLSMPLIQEIVLLSADIRCTDCQEKIADIMSRMIETYSILVSVLEKKVTLTCTYSGDPRRVTKSYGEALLCKMSTFKRRIFASSRKQQLNVT